MSGAQGPPTHAQAIDFAKTGKSTLILAFGRVLILILSIVAASLLTRYLGVSRYGAFATVTAIATIFTSASALIGTAAARYGIHYLAKEEVGKAVDVFRTSLRLTTYASAVIAATFVALSFVLQSRTLLLLVIPFTVFSFYKDILLNVFYALYKLHLYVLEGVLFQALMILSVLVFIPPFGLEGGFMALNLAALIDFLVVYALARRLLLRKYPRQPSEVGPREMLKYSIPYYISGLVSSVQIRGGVLVLAYFAFAIGIEEAGHFNLAISLIIYGSTVLFSLADAAGPMLGKFQSQANPEKFQTTVEEILRFSLVFTVPAVFALFSLADPVMAFLFGNDFRPAGLPLTVLGVGLISHILRKVFIGVLLANFVTRFTAVAEVASLGLFGALAWLLTPRYGAVGTSAAFVASSFLAAVLYIYKGHRLGTAFPARRFVGIVLPGVVFLAALPVPGPTLLRAGLLLALLSVYLWILKLLGHFDSKDLRSIFQLFQRAG